MAAAAEQRQITVSPIGRFAIAPVERAGWCWASAASARPQIEAGVEVLAEVLERP